jgi:hypothetical protein
VSEATTTPSHKKPGLLRLEGAFGEYESLNLEVARPHDPMPFQFLFRSHQDLSLYLLRVPGPNDAISRTSATFSDLVADLEVIKKGLPWPNGYQYSPEIRWSAIVQIDPAPMNKVSNGVRTAVLLSLAPAPYPADLSAGLASLSAEYFEYLNDRIKESRSVEASISIAFEPHEILMEALMDIQREHGEQIRELNSDFDKHFDGETDTTAAHLRYNELRRQFDLLLEDKKSRAVQRFMIETIETRLALPIFDVKALELAVDDLDIGLGSRRYLANLKFQVRDARLFQRALAELFAAGDFVPQLKFKCARALN